MAKFDPVMYSKNVLRSAGYVGVEAIKGVNPSLSNLIKESIGATKEMYTTTKDFIKNPTTAIRDYIGDEAAKAAGDVKRNILDDIRTGKFYNPDRERSDQNANMSELLGFNFDDLDLDVDEDYGEDKSEKGTPQRSIENLSITQQKLTQASTDTIVRNADANTTRTLTQQAKMMGLLNGSLSSINTSILNLHNAIAKPLDAHIQNSTNFYKTTTELMAKQTSYLENINKLLTQHVNKGTSESERMKKKSGKSTPWQDVMGGGFDPGAFFGHIKNNLLEKVLIGQFKDFMDPEAIKMMRASGAFSSPIALISTMVLTNYLQNGPIGDALNRTESIINGGITNTFMKIHNYRKKNKFKRINKRTGKLETKNKNPILGFLADIFDIVPDKGLKGSVKGNGVPYKGATQWTGLNDKALQEVIPTQLAQIISLLSGEEVQLYNYNTGKFQRASNIQKQFRKDRKTNITNTTDELKNKFLGDYINKKNKNGERVGFNTRYVRNIADEYNTFVSLVAMRGYNVANLSGQQLFNLARQFERRELLSHEAVKVFKKYLFTGKFESSLKSTLMNAQSADRDYLNSAKYDSTFDSLTAAGLTSNEDKWKGKKAKGKNSKLNPIINPLLRKDDLGNDVYFYLQNYYHQLDYIVHRIETGDIGIGKKIKSRKGRGGWNKNVVSFDDYRRNNINRIKNKREEEAKTAEELNAERAKNNKVRNNKFKAEHSNDVWDSSKKRYTKDGILETYGAENGVHDSSVANLLESFNDNLERIFFGTNPTRDDRNYGILGPIKKISDKVSEIVVETKNLIKEWLKKKWDEFKDSDFWQRFTGQYKKTGKAAKDWVSTNANVAWSRLSEQDPNKRTNDAVARINGYVSNGAAHGGMVTRSGIVSVSEGEMIIPSEMNPYYHGRTNKYTQKFNEKQNYNNWRKATGGRSRLPYWGSFAEGGNVSIGDSIRDKVEQLMGTGRDLKEIITIINRMYSKKVGGKKLDSEVTKIYTGLQDAAKRAGKTVKSEVEGFEDTAIVQIAEKSVKVLTDNIREPIKAYIGEKKKNANEYQKDIMRVLNQKFPETMATGSMGALIGGALTGSGIGLLGGFVVGAGVNILKESKLVSKFLFGEFDPESREYNGGVIPSKFVKMIKDKAPKLLKSAALGGIIGGMGILPGGIIGGAVAATTLQVLYDVKTIRGTLQTALFGEEGVDGKRRGGVIGSIQVRIVDPIADFVKKKMDGFDKYFKENFLNPLLKIFRPMSDWIAGKGIKVMEGVGHALQKAADDTFTSLGRVFDATVGRALGLGEHAAEKIVNGAGKLASLPFKAIGKTADAWERHNVRAGYSTRSAQERIDLTKGKTSAYNYKLAELQNKGDKAGAEKLTLDTDFFARGLDSAKGDAEQHRRETKNKIIASLNSGGIGKEGQKLGNDIDRLMKGEKATAGDFSEVTNYINNLSPEEMNDSNKKLVEELLGDESKYITAHNERVANYGQKRSDFFKRTFGININANATDKQAEKILSRLGLKDQAYTDRRHIDKETTDKYYGKINKQNELEKLRNENPLEGDSNKQLHGISGFLEKIANWVDKTFINKDDNKDEGEKEKTVTPAEAAINNTVANSQEYKDAYDSFISAGMSPEDAKQMALDTIGGPIFGPIKNATTNKNTNKNKPVTKEEEERTSLELFNELRKNGLSMEEAMGEAFESSRPKTPAEAAIAKNNEPKEPKEGDKQTDADGKQYEIRNGRPELDMADGETRRKVEEERKDKEETRRFHNLFLGGGFWSGMLSFFGNKKKKEGGEDKEKKGGLLGGLFGGISGIFGGIGDAIGGYKQGVATLLAGGNPELGSLLSMASGGGGPLGILGKVAPFLIIPGILTVAYLFNKDKVDGFLKGLDFGDTSSGLGLVLDKTRNGLLLIGDTLDKELGPLGDSLLDFAEKVKTNLPYIKESAGAVLETIGTTYTQFNDPEQGLHAIINTHPKLSEDNPFKDITETLCGVTKILEIPVLGLSYAAAGLVKIAGLPIINGLVRSAASAITGMTDDISYCIKGDVMGVLSNDWMRNSIATHKKGDNISTAIAMIVPFSLEAVTKPITVPLSAISWGIHRVVDIVGPVLNGIMDGASGAITTVNNAFKCVNEGDVLGAIALGSEGLTKKEDYNGMQNFGAIVTGLVLTPIKPALVVGAAISKTIKIFDSVFNSTPYKFDQKQYISELNEYKDPDKPISGYDKVVEKYTNDAKKSGVGSIGAQLGISIIGWVQKIPITISRAIKSVFGFFDGGFDKFKEWLLGKDSDVNGGRSGAKIKSTTVNSTTGEKLPEYARPESVGDREGVGLTIDNSNTLKRKEHNANSWYTLDAGEYDLASGSGIHVRQEGRERYGGSTLADVGCGPAAAATVLRSYGKRANLRSAANYARNRGYEVGGASGTKASYFNDVFAANGIKSGYVTGSNISNAVSSGRPTVLLGQDKSNKSKANSPFGPNPHYVVASGTDRHGNVFIDDPELRTTALYKKDILKNASLGIATGGASGTDNINDNTLMISTGSNAAKSTSLSAMDDSSSVGIGSNVSSNNSGLPKAANNAEAIWGYYKSLGLSDEAVAGILGNVKGESGGNYNPKTVEHLFVNHLNGKSGGKWVTPGNIYKDYGVDVSSYDRAYETYTQALDNKKISLDEFQHPYKEYVTKTGDSSYKSDKSKTGHEWLQYGYGLVGFTDPGLKAELYNATVEKGKSISDLGSQLDVLTNQLRACGVWDKISNNNNITAQKAAEYMLMDYEKPSNASDHIGTRGSYALDFLNQYRGKNFDISGYVSGMPSANSSTTGTKVPEFHKYQLNDSQIRGIANILGNEQGSTNYRGLYAEASLMANLLEKKYGEAATVDQLVSWLRLPPKKEVKKGEPYNWFAKGRDRYDAGANGGGNAVTQQSLQAATDVFVEGHRTFPRYIDEHDMLGKPGQTDIDHITDLNGNDAGDKFNKNNYIPHQTVVHQGSSVGSGKWTFFNFPDGVDGHCDPFGYASKNLYEKYKNDGFYQVDKSGNVSVGQMGVNGSGFTDSGVYTANSDATSSSNEAKDIGSIISKFFGTLFKGVVDAVSGPAKSLLKTIFGISDEKEQSNTSNTTTGENGISTEGNTDQEAAIVKAMLDLTGKLRYGQGNDKYPLPRQDFRDGGSGDCSSTVGHVLSVGVPGLNLEGIDTDGIWTSSKGRTVDKPDKAPSSSKDHSGSGPHIDKLRPGDALLYKHSNSKTTGHVELYLGDNKRSGHGGGIGPKITPVTDDGGRYLGARRFTTSTLTTNTNSNATTGSNATAASSSGGVTYGDYNSVINGFPYYNQGVEPWKSTSYGTFGGEHKTLGGSGCGPTSMAMVMKSYGLNVTPKDVADYALANGFYKGNGTDRGLYASVGTANGLTVSPEIAGNDRATVESYLKQGIPLVNSQTKGHFAQGRHIISIVGIDNNGNYYVNDPSWENGRKRSLHSWKPEEVYKLSNYFYAVSKNGEGSIGNSKYGNKKLTPTEPSIDGSNRPGGSSGLPLYDFTGGASGAINMMQASNRLQQSIVTNNSAQNYKPMDYNEIYNNMLKLLAQIAANTTNNSYLPTIVELIKELGNIIGTMNNSGGTTTVVAEDKRNQINQDLSRIMAKIDEMTTSL